MAPIAMMHNALDVDEGGSGVPLDRRAYQRSVEVLEPACQLALIART